MLGGVLASAEAAAASTLGLVSGEGGSCFALRLARFGAAEAASAADDEAPASGSALTAVGFDSSLTADGAGASGTAAASFGTDASAASILAFRS